MHGIVIGARHAQFDERDLRLRISRGTHGPHGCRPWSDRYPAEGGFVPLPCRRFGLRLARRWASGRLVSAAWRDDFRESLPVRDGALRSTCGLSVGHHRIHRLWLEWGSVRPGRDLQGVAL